MPEIVKTKRLKDRTARRCKVIVTKEDGQYVVAEGGAVVKASEKSTILNTNKYKYSYIERSYFVILCNLRRFNYEPTIEFLRNVEKYDICLTFAVGGKEDKDILIEDVQPIRIDSAGDWEFALTETEVEKIARLNTDETQKILY